MHITTWCPPNDLYNDMAPTYDCIVYRVVEGSTFAPQVLLVLVHKHNVQLISKSCACDRSGACPECSARGSSTLYVDTASTITVRTLFGLSWANRRIVWYVTLLMYTMA